MNRFLSALIASLLTAFIIHSFAFGQVEGPSWPKQPGEDWLGYLSRNHQYYRRNLRLVFAPQDDLTWAEREAKYDFRIDGLRVDDPVMLIKNYNSNIVFSEGEGPYFGLGRIIERKARALAGYNFDLHFLMTPNEFSRQLGQFAQIAASEENIDPKTGVDYRFRIHAKIAKINLTKEHGFSGTKFNYEKLEFEGDIDPNLPVFHQIILVTEFINPETHRLMKAIGKGERLTDELAQMNGGVRERMVLNHLTPASWRIAESEKSPNAHDDKQGVATAGKVLKREDYEIDIEKFVINADFVFSNEYYSKLGSFRKTLQRQVQDPNFDLDVEYPQIAFLIERETVEGTEFVWITSAKIHNSYLEGVIDNQSVLSKKADSSTKYVGPLNFVDVAYVLDGTIQYGGSLHYFLQLMENGDRRAIQRGLKHKLPMEISSLKE